MSFVHLHVHSHYSLLDGLPKIDGLVNRAKTLGMPALALTDHGVMYGALEFYQKARVAGIKPIIGLEGYLAPGSRFDKNANEKPYHQILLARDLAGYKNLMKLSTLSHLEGFYYKPRFDKELLRQYHEGLIATSSCLQGEVAQIILRRGEAAAVEAIREWQDIFGPENFYLEIQDHSEIPEQTQVNNALFALAEKTRAGLILTKDVHYLERSDAEAQDILLCVQTGKTVDDKNRLDMRGTDLSFLAPEQLSAAFPEHPEILAETVKLAGRCSLELELGKFFFPVFSPPSGLTADEHLKNLAYEGLQNKYGRLSDERQKRLDYELEVVKKKKYAPYFLIVADYVNWARSQGIISTTRGSAAGSLASHAIGITTVNPLDYNLPFERFLNPHRPTAPDIDMDFADNRRDEVIEYVRQKYGGDKVAQICTFGTMLARGAVRDAGRALGLPYGFCDRIAKLIPTGKQGFPMTIERALAESPELRSLYQQDENAGRLLDIARKVEGSARHPSVHAAGVVIAPTPLTDYTPLQRETGGEKIITQYEMHSAEAAGLVKMDLLGIRNLSILGTAVAIVKKTKQTAVDIDNLPLDDAKTFALLAAGRTMGLFQLGGEGMTRYLVELKPTKITDIMAMVALFRPGPMESIPEFITRKHNPQRITYLDERLKTILADSYGIITYQDDVLYVAIEIAGYSWEEADKLRKAMGKKIPKEMAKQKDKFIAGCREHGKLASAKAAKLWQLIEPFAAYGFNKAHAASYGMVAYQTAYLKAHFPAEFMAAVMTEESGDIDKVAEAMAECSHLGIKVLPPDSNESFANFTVIDDKTVRFGLLAIKNIGAHIVEQIIAERKQNGPYRDLADFLKRVTDKDLNHKSLESFIRAGVFDRFGNRAALEANIAKLLAFAREAQHAAKAGQESLFGTKDADGPILSLPSADANRALELRREKELLGFYLSGHPLEEHRELLAKQGASARNAAAGAAITVNGLVRAVKQVTTKKGELMAFVELEDLTDAVEVIVFPKTYLENKTLWQADKLLWVRGRVEERGEKKQIICQAAGELPLNAPDADTAPTDNDGSGRARLEIHLPASAPVAIFAKLKKVLYDNLGDTAVILRINNSKIIRLPVKISASDELIKTLGDLVGQERIKIT